MNNERSLKSHCETPEPQCKLWVAQFENHHKKTGCMLIKAKDIREAKGIIRNESSYCDIKDMIELHEVRLQEFTEPGIIVEVKNI